MPSNTYTPHDESNTTTTTLTGSATWTGAWRRVPDDSNIFINSKADVSGTLFLQFSNSADGTNSSDEPTLGYSCGPNILEAHAVVPVAPYFRAKYTNDSTAQTSFELYTYYFPRNYPKLAPYNKRIGRDENAMPTRPSDPQDDISRSLRAGVSWLNKWGYRDDVDTADGDALIIADDTTNTPTILTSSSTFTVTYTNTTDGSGTTGALSLLFTYLDENEAQQTATHTLGSSGSDVTTFSGLGINRCVVLSSGSGDTNGSDITVTATTGGSVQAFLPAGTSVTQQVLGHVPANTTGVAKFLFLSALRIAGGSSPRVTFKVFVYNRGTDTTYEVFRYGMDTAAENHLEVVDPINFVFSARDVFWITANTDTNNTSVSGRLSLNLYEAN